jgi:beta-glucosidase-like glycosyl hydrolase
VSARLLLVERLGTPKIMVSDGPHGLRARPAERDRLGLGGSLPATCLPTASAIASAWDPELLGRVLDHATLDRVSQEWHQDASAGPR